MRVATLLLIAALSGCATIMAGGPDHVPVNSNPPGAAVYVDNQLVGQTPMVVTLNREHSAGVIRVEAPGYVPVTVVRAKGINGWFWANLCIGGVIGMVIDLVTGDVKAFDDTPIAVGMTPGGGYGPPPPGAPPGPPPGPAQQPPPGYPGAAAPPPPAPGY
jgi:hypothetical protein